MNRFPLLSKLLAIGLLTALLATALATVSGLVDERRQTRQAAVEQIARAHAGEQTLSGPVLAIPYTETYPVRVDTPGLPGQPHTEMKTREAVAIQFPQTWAVDASLDTEVRQRGIFPVTVYTSEQQARGRFVVQPVRPRASEGQVTLGQPRLLLGTSDLRGLRSAPRLRVNGQDLTVTPSPADSPAALPLTGLLPAAAATPDTVLEVQIDLHLAGTGRIAWMPLAHENTVHLRSPWPHPSFDGDLLPSQRQVGEGGFEATWRIPSLSTRAQQQFLTHLREPAGAVEAFGVSLSDPVDPYRLADRATKYGLLFVLLTFAAFFVLEMVKRWRIHPMQYLMVGSAMVLFFLLLLSLSEHMPFVLAYLAASGACITLLGHYLRHVLGGWHAGLGLAGMLVALYGVLYGILVSEDNALMMGSLLLFGVLAAIMVATRRLNWYSVMGTDARPAATAHHRG